MRDALTVARKELLEMPWNVGQGGSWSGWLLVLTYLLLFGIIYPAGHAAEYGSSAFAVLLPCLAAFFVLNAAAESFAGERERHTIETLLATPLTDAGILFGKVIGIAASGALTGWAQVLVAWCSARMAVGHAIRWDGVVLAAAATVPPLLSFCLSALGVLFSLRSSSVRQAVQLSTAAVVLGGATVGATLRRSAVLEHLVFSQPLGMLIYVLSALVLVAMIAVLLALPLCRRHLLSL